MVDMRVSLFFRQNTRNTKCTIYFSTLATMTWRKRDWVPGQQSEFSREALTTIWYNVLCNFNIYILNFEIVIAVDDLGHYQSSFLLWASHNYLNGWRGFLKLIQLNRNSCLKEFLPFTKFEPTFASLLSHRWIFRASNRQSSIGEIGCFWKQIIITEKG